MSATHPQGEAIAEESTLEITDEEFDSVLQAYPYVVVDFWAEWCAPCHILARTLEKLAGKYAGQVRFARLNVDTGQLTAAKYGIMGLPTLLFFKRRKLVDAIVGAVPEGALDLRLQKHL